MIPRKQNKLYFIQFFIGCHKDSFEARLLTGSISKSQEKNSKKHCIEKCKNEGYSLAGMQYGNECFCGEKSIKDLNNFKIEEEKCNKKCPGAPSEACGGYLTMNIYHTGSVPSKPGPSVLPVPGKNFDTLVNLFLYNFIDQYLAFRVIRQNFYF